MNKPFLVTGCGRSGTAWASHFFTKMGRPCGHEQQFAPWANGPLRRPESSWLAIPYLPDIPDDIPIVRMMRNPHDVVRSVIARGFLRERQGAYEEFVATHRPAITEGPDHLTRAILWVGLWDMHLDMYDHRVLRVDHHSQESLADAFEYATGTAATINDVKTGLLQVGGKINANRPWLGVTGLPTDPQINRHPYGHLIVARAKEFGYA
jgi:hypothetical protein